MKKTFLICATIAVGGLTNSIGFAAAAPDGAALYAMNCVSCHGPLATSNKAGATAAMIQNAITNNFGGMGSLSNLAVADIQAIAAALYMNSSVPAPAPTPGSPTPSPSLSPTTQPAPPWDGAALYGSYCSSCHGPLASSTKLGATESQIQSAISSNTGGMGYFSSLTSAQISAIATALAGNTSSPSPIPAIGGGIDGASLYTANCSSCHGQLAGSSVMGATASGIQSAINSNKGGMSKLSGLSPTDLQAIATALASGSGASGGGEGEGSEGGENGAEGKGGGDE